jgi:hypothetical protein
MVKVIETNISLGECDHFADFQSRVIEVDSWESYISEIKTNKSEYRTSCIGSLQGNSLPRNAKVSNLDYSDLKLSCIVTTVLGFKIHKLAYRT